MYWSQFNWDSSEPPIFPRISYLFGPWLLSRKKKVTFLLCLISKRWDFSSSIVKLPSRSFMYNHSSFSVISLFNFQPHPQPFLKGHALQFISARNQLLPWRGVGAGGDRVGIWGALPPLSGMAFCPPSWVSERTAQGSEGSSRIRGRTGLPECKAGRGGHTVRSLEPC